MLDTDSKELTRRHEGTEMFFVERLADTPS
jgi:hypothetical protein